MTVIISDTLDRKLAVIKRKAWWPVATLAEILGRPKGYIYRRVEKEAFKIVRDGEGPMKISSESVINYFEDS